MKKFKIITMTLGLMLLFTLGSVASSEDVNVTINDPKADVMDFYKALQGIYSGGDYNEDIDIKTISYEKSEGSTKLSFDLEVFGKILDSGDVSALTGEMDPDMEETDPLSMISKLKDPIVYYAISFQSSEEIYTFNYINTNCSVTIAEETIWDLDYEINNGVLSSSFNLKNEDETIENITVETTYMKIDIDLSSLSDPSNAENIDESSMINWYSDSYPNMEGFFASFYTEPTNPQPDEETEITASIYGGTEPYSYKWDFGDGSESTGWLDDPGTTHIFEEKGTYTVNLTVEDNEGNLSYAELPVFVGTENLDDVNQTGDTNSSRNKNNNDGFLAAATSGNAGLIAFIALVAIILVAGLAVLYYISKR